MFSWYGWLVVFTGLHCFFVRVIPLPYLFKYLLEAFTSLEDIRVLVVDLSTSHWSRLEDNEGHRTKCIGVLVIWMFPSRGDTVSLHTLIDSWTAYFWTYFGGKGVFHHPLFHIAVWKTIWTDPGPLQTALFMFPPYT